MRRRPGIPRVAVAPRRLVVVEPAPAQTAPEDTVPQPYADRAETASVEAFVTSRGEQLLRLAYLVTGSHADAEDLLQETLADVHRKWDRVCVSEHPYAYVRTMLNHRHISARRRKWHGEHPTDPADVAVLDRRASDPTAAVDGQDEMWQLLATLPPRMRTVLVLRYFEDLDDDEIARTLGIGVSSVRASASRALATLRTKGVHR